MAIPSEQTHRTANEPDAEYPESAGAWKLLGHLLEKHLAHYEEAELAYRRAIQLAPDDLSLWNRLGDLLQEHIFHPNEVEQAYCKAIELALASPRCH